MAGISALYFPDFLPPPAAAAALAALFAPLRCYRPLPDDHAAPPAPWAELHRNGGLEFYQPLATDRTDLVRLQGLLAELEGRSGQETALFVQGILSRLGADRQELASELAGPLRGFSDDPAAREERETLWRALLLLKLAENQQRRELELEEELRNFEQRRAALFRQLRGEEEETAERKAAGGGAAVQQAARNSGLLLRAWCQLFLRDQQGAGLLVSADPDAVALLLEIAAGVGGREPLSSGSLPLPADPATRAGLVRALQKVAAGGTLEALTALTLPGREGGIEGPRVEFYLLPETPLSALAARLGRRPGPEPSRNSGRQEPPHGLVALFRAAAQR